MELSEALAVQYKQQQKLIGSLPVDRDEQRELAKRMATYLIGEIYEYLDSISYRHFLPIDEKPRESRLLELVDVFKFFLALCWTEDVSSEELERLFLAKTNVVYERHENKLLSTKIAGFDIDGVLAEWPLYDLQDREAFFESGGAMRMLPVNGARDALTALKATGWAIVLVTARKVARHERLEHETHQWLLMNDMPYDKILWGYDKSDTILRSRLSFSFFVEDHPKHALDLAMSGINVFFVGKEEVHHERIKSVSGAREIADIVISGKDISTMFNSLSKP